MAKTKSPKTTLAKKQQTNSTPSKKPDASPPTSKVCNYTYSQEAVEVLEKVKATKGIKLNDFVSQAVIKHGETYFGVGKSPKERILDGKLDYLLEAIVEEQYEALKTKKPTAIKNVTKKIKAIAFDVDTMDIKELKKACKPSKRSTKTLYTVAFAVKYGFHDEE